VACLDPGLDALEKLIKGRIKERVRDWRIALGNYVSDSSGAELQRFVEEQQEELKELEPDAELDHSLLDLFYRIISLDPFDAWIRSDETPERADRLAKFTKLIEDFSRVSGLRKIQKSSWLEGVSKKMISSFYWDFCGLLVHGEVDDPEDIYDQIPEGYVQVMTIHQAKGLEFPVVFADSLDTTPRTGGTYWIEDIFEDYSGIGTKGPRLARATRDLVRLNYVAYSRPETDLILTGKENDPTQYTFGYDGTGNELDTDWFNGAREIGDPADFMEEKTGDGHKYSKTSLKRRYSITGDIMTYRTCRKQYGYFNEMGFVPPYEIPWSYGRMVHDTLDFAHRHYKGDIEGVDGGQVPSDYDIETYFNSVVNAMRAQNTCQVSQKASERALQKIKEFNRIEGPKIYPKIKDTEHHLQAKVDEYIIEGVVDVIMERDRIEIMDYKVSKKPPEGDPKYRDYRSQLQTYAELYRKKNGQYPDRGSIYFIGEERLQDSRYTVNINPDQVHGFIGEFKETIRQIESDRENRNWFKIRPDERPEEETCKSCGLKWSCIDPSD